MGWVCSVAGERGGTRPITATTSEGDRTCFIVFIVLMAARSERFFTASASERLRNHITLVNVAVFSVLELPEATARPT